MLGMISVDRTAVRGFADLMKRCATDFAQVRREHTPGFAGSGDDTGPDSKWRGGIRVNLGAVDHQHRGSRAGEILADRIAETLNFVISMEEGARALGEIAEATLTAMGDSDEIAADDLESILRRMDTVPADNPYGERSWLRPDTAPGGDHD